MMAHLENCPESQSIMHIETIANMLRDLESLYDAMQRELKL